jgi:hypothetical protein
LRLKNEPNPIKLRVHSLKIYQDRLEFALQAHKFDGCTITHLVIARTLDGKSYNSELRYTNHEQRDCIGRFAEFSHEFESR